MGRKLLLDTIMSGASPILWPAGRKRLASTFDWHIARGSERAVLRLSPAGKHMLEYSYIAWAADKEAARNEGARFLSWVNSYTKGEASP
jgi:hypothetical protein